MKRLNIEALIYCIAWAALAVIGWRVAGPTAGLLLSAGLFLVIMPTSALILSQTGNFAAERGVRWAILVAAALALASFADLSR